MELECVLVSGDEVARFHNDIAVGYSVLYRCFGVIDAGSGYSLAGYRIESGGTYIADQRIAAKRVGFSPARRTDAGADIDLVIQHICHEAHFA